MSVIAEAISRDLTQLTRSPDFRTILTHVRSTADSEAVLRLAVEFARERNAHLIGIGGDEPYLPTGPYLDGELVHMVAERAAEDLKIAADRFARAAAPLGNRAHWRVIRERACKALADEAAGADLIVAALERSDRRAANDCADLVLDTGLPVLAIPSTLSVFNPKHVLVAWRNTAEAHRMLTASVPILQAAQTVVLIEVARADRTQDAWTELHAAANRLARHGVNADAVVRRSDGDTASTLLAEAEARGSDLIALGAYGHSRTREWVLGGVTQDLLEKTPLPLLMVH